MTIISNGKRYSHNDSDLSGYIAYTDAHGSIMSSNLVEKCVQIVEGSLVGDCQLNERTGGDFLRYYRQVVVEACCQVDMVFLNSRLKR